MRRRISARLRAFLIGAIALSVVVIASVALAADPGGHIQAARDLLAQADAELQAAQAEPLATVTETITETITETVTQGPPPPATTTTTPPPPPACDFNVPAPSQDGTALRTYLLTVPEGTAADPSVVCFQPNASYTTSQQLSFTNLDNVYFDLEGASIHSTSTSLSRQVFVFTGGSNLRVDDGFLDGTLGGSVNNGHAINIQGVAGFGSDGISIGLVADDGFRVAMNSTLQSRPNSTNVVIENCVTTLPRRHAISVVGADHTTIRGCDLGIDNSDAGGTIIDIEPLGGDDVDDVLIADNVLRAYSASSARREVQVNGAPGSFITNVVVRNNAMDKVGMVINNNSGSVERSANITFSGNHAITEPGPVRNEPIVLAERTDGLTVTDNSANLAAGVAWVTCTDACIGVVNTGNVDTTP